MDYSFAKRMSPQKWLPKRLRLLNTKQGVSGCVLFLLRATYIDVVHMHTHTLCISEYIYIYTYVYIYKPTIYIYMYMYISCARCSDAYVRAWVPKHAHRCLQALGRPPAGGPGGPGGSGRAGAAGGAPEEEVVEPEEATPPGGGGGGAGTGGGGGCRWDSEQGFAQWTHLGWRNAHFQAPELKNFF